MGLYNITYILIYHHITLSKGPDFNVYTVKIASIFETRVFGRKKVVFSKRNGAVRLIN